MKRITRWLIFVVPVFILLTGLSLYLSHFNGQFSAKVQDWSSFGTYINPFITLANVSLFIIFSLLVYRYNNSINRPILTFKTVPNNGNEVWQISNIGNGPALNLVVSYKAARKSKWIDPSVKCYSLGKNENVNLDWLTGSVDVIGVYYKDIFDDAYVAIVGDDITEIRKYSTFKSFAIADHNYTKKDFDELLKLGSIRIMKARYLSRTKSNPQISSSITTETTRRDG